MKAVNSTADSLQKNVNSSYFNKHFWSAGKLITPSARPFEYARVLQGHQKILWVRRRHK